MRQLTPEEVYGSEVSENMINESLIFYDNNTCVEIVSKNLDHRKNYSIRFGDRIWEFNPHMKYYKIVNPYSMNIPVINWKRILHREDNLPAIEFEDLSKVYYVDGKLHRTDGPAIIGKNSKYLTISERYYVDGKLHRTDGPAEILCDDSGIKEYERYYIDGKLHRTDGPADIRYFDNGFIKIEKYYVNGIMTRSSTTLDGDGPGIITRPAYIEYYKDGGIESESYFVDGARHKTDGPACITYRCNGKVYCSEYFTNGLRHRTDGPSFIKGKLKEYYINNEKLSKFEFNFKKIFKKI